jgi:sterol desaturase/sphingolipid hydroxylase (fatty acid hydroxylase superfamily)
MFESIISAGNLPVWGAAVAVAVAIVAGHASGFFAARKIQSRGMDLRQLRREALLAILTVGVVGTLLTVFTDRLHEWGLIEFRAGPAAWWVVALEYLLYWFYFDAFFYWAHRLIHIEPLYTWVHKAHHLSTKPNMLTSLSNNPLEPALTGLGTPLFFMLVTVHEEARLLILPTALIMGFYVHSGYELMPRWWNRNPVTKWIVTATFHDQHHRYFTGNYGAYMTIWDRFCGTVRSRYDIDFRSERKSF